MICSINFTGAVSQRMCMHVHVIFQASNSNTVMLITTPDMLFHLLNRVYSSMHGAFSEYVLRQPHSKIVNTTGWFAALPCSSAKASLSLSASSGICWECPICQSYVSYVFVCWNVPAAAVSPWYILYGIWIVYSATPHLCVSTVFALYVHENSCSMLLLQCGVWLVTQ